jgi:hypothetical protein
MQQPTPHTTDAGYEERILDAENARLEGLSSDVHGHATTAVGAIVAYVDADGSPRAGIVAEVIDRHPDNDHWRILDEIGNEAVVDCTTVPVIDDERLEELRATLADHEDLRRGDGLGA